MSNKEPNSMIVKLVPSRRLLRAALSGLVATSAVACEDKSSDGAKSNAQDLSDEELSALCADVPRKAEAGQVHGEASAGSQSKSEDLDTVCKDKVEEAKKSVPKPDTAVLCADSVKSATEAALKPKAPEEKTINSEQKEYTFAQLTKMCDDRGGYVHVQAACGSQNTCKGFSYGDWGPGAATLTEHSCTGANGCKGLSCVISPEDRHGKKSGKELYDLKFGDTEPGACTNCHAVHDDQENADVTKFKVYVLAGSSRNASNWLELSAAEQERKVAFGVHYTNGKGLALQNMAPYNQVLSRKEIERVVAHLRTLTPVITTIKVADP